jgi:large subunit ribosomal protein L13
VKTTVSAKAEEIERRWYIVDAASAPLGRMATNVANVLRGKNKPIWSPHVDCGDHVIVINAESLQLSGNKLDGKLYDTYSGFPSGRHVRSARTQMDKDPTQVVIHAVKGMLPKNKLGRAMIKKLKVYAGSEHPHAAQKPQELTLKV